MSSYFSPESRVPQTHPLRPIRTMADKALEELSPVFRELHLTITRPSIPPEQLLRSLLLQILYSIRSERMLVEQLDYNLLFRWFVGLPVGGTTWSHTVYAKNKDHILRNDLAVLFLWSIWTQAEAAGLLSDDHFTVDGTLIESWASSESVRPPNKGLHTSSGDNCKPETGPR